MIKKLGIPKINFRIGYCEKDGSNKLELKILARKINEIITVVNRLDRDKNTKKIVEKLDEIHETLYSIDFGVGGNGNK